MTETAARFGSFDHLVGVRSEPNTRLDDRREAVILLSAGNLHRVGPNRLYVRLVRHLASLGYPTLRFDASGVGDSGPRLDGAPVPEGHVRDTVEAMDFLQNAAGHERFVLAGVCSGGSVAFRTACLDARVAAVVPINPHDHLHDLTDTRVGATLRSRTLARHYWRLAASSSLRGKNWRRLLAGRVDVAKLARDVLGAKRPPARVAGAPIRETRARALARIDALSGSRVRHLHVFSEGDEGLDYLRVILGQRLDVLVRDHRLAVRIIPAANHTFSLLSSQRELIAIVEEWLGSVQSAET